jgi:TRAP-type C4-dicarboxylate transport system permease small subunit
VTTRVPPYQSNPLLALFDRAEEKVLCLLLAAMIVLACLQIFLRTAVSGGLLWIDPLLRYLVLWSGLLGAVAATGQGKHIALDLFSQRLPAGLVPYLTLVVQLFSCLAAAGLTWAGWLFLAGEIESGGEGPLGVPLWFYNGIFPVSFALIALKSGLLLWLELRTLMVGNAGAR